MRIQIVMARPVVVGPYSSLSDRRPCSKAVTFASVISLIERIASFVLHLAEEPKWYRERMAEVGRKRSFVRYVLPFDPHHWIGGGAL